jgi:hypothetical protein
MSNASTSRSNLIATATTKVTECINQLQDELDKIAEDILSALPERARPIGKDQVHKPAQDFLETVDLLDTLVPYISAPLRGKFQSMLIGIENAVALAHGFICNLPLSKTAESAIEFEIPDRRTGRSVRVVLPPLSYLAAVEDLRKALRDLKKIHRLMLESPTPESRDDSTSAPDSGRG